jgi:hypothetical protein
MAGDTRSTVALLASLLLLSSFPFLSGAETTDVVFEVEETSSQSNEWYTAGDTVELTALFTNSGSQASIANDPSCGVVLQVSNASGALLIDDLPTCRGQTQSIDLAEGETHFFDVFPGVRDGGARRPLRSREAVRAHDPRAAASSETNHLRAADGGVPRSV